MADSSVTRSFEAAVREALDGTGVEAILITDPEDFELELVPYGVINLFAPWSGPCFVCLKVLAAMKLPTPKPWLHVLDVSRMPDAWLKETFGIIPHGRGETFWVRSGAIIASDEGFSVRPADVARHTAKLFHG